MAKDLKIRPVCIPTTSFMDTFIQIPSKLHGKLGEAIGKHQDVQVHLAGLKGLFGIVSSIVFFQHQLFTKPLHRFTDQLILMSFIFFNIYTIILQVFEIITLQI